MNPTPQLSPEEARFQREYRQRIAAGEIGYDAQLGGYFDRDYLFELHRDAQALLNEWERAGVIVRDGDKVTLA